MRDDGAATAFPCPFALAVAFALELVVVVDTGWMTGEEADVCTCTFMFSSDRMRGLGADEPGGLHTMEPRRK